MTGYDKLVTLGAALAAPVLTLLVDTHVLTAAVATDLGAIVAAAVGAYHLPSDSARAALHKVKAAQAKTDSGT